MNRINLICLGVRNMQKALAFYKAVGFLTKETEDCPPVVFFNNQGSKLELYPLQELAKDINGDTPPPLAKVGFCGITLACNMKSKNEVDDVMFRVEQAGGTVVKRPQEVFWGGYSGYFQDLDGYYWEVAYADFWQFDKNDMLVIS